MNENWTAFDWKSCAGFSGRFLKNSSSLSKLFSLKLPDKKYAFEMGLLCNIPSMQRSKENQRTDTWFKIVLSKFIFSFRTFIKPAVKINSKIFNVYIKYFRRRIARMTGCNMD